MNQNLISAIVSATSLTNEQVAKTLVQPKEFAHGDFSFPCFILAKEWKVAPPECAKKLQGLLALPEEIEKSEVVGPYLNFFLKRDNFAKKVICDILQAKTDAGKGGENKETVLIEYSSPNIAKPFHIGHLRTTLIGHSLDRIYRYLGYNVISMNHLGDWGTQFGFVWAGCELWGRPENPTIFELVDIYIRASALRKAQDEQKVPEEDADKPNVNEMARGYFRRLEADEPEAIQFWQMCLDVTLDYLKRLYQRLGVNFDYYRGESYYRAHLKEVEQTLRNSGILQDSRGALGVDLGKPLGFVRIFAEDGRSLYITRDIAAADDRYNNFHPDQILIVVAAPQEFYFKQFFSVMKKLNHPVAPALKHISYGNIPNISTRNGAGKDSKIWLHALLEEAHQRALDAYRNQVEKRPEGIDEEVVAESVGIGAICFNYLSRSNIKEFNFTWEEALNFQGDTGPYVQYALARLNSIENKAAQEGLVASENFDASLLTEKEAHIMVSLLSKFHDTIQLAANEHEPYHLALYVLELARTFSSAYKALRVVGQPKEIAQARLALFVATKYVLHRGLTLIGVPPVERM